MYSCIVLLLCIPAAVLAVIRYPDDNPDKSCNCIPLSECHSAFAKLKSSHHRDYVTHKAFTKYLGLINCGYEGAEPRVCCPNEIPKEVVRIVENKRYWIKSQEQKSIKRLKGAIWRAKQSNVLIPYQASTERPTPAPRQPNYQFPGCGRYEWREDLYGNATYLGEYPWLALLEYDTFANGKQLLCGGVLISDQHILTAAHCVTGLTDKLSSVILGEHDTSANPECIADGANNPPLCVDSMRKYDVDYTIPHGGYNDAILHRDPLADNSLYALHDIALVKLNTRVQLTSHVYPICLPTRAPTMTSFKIAGWSRQSSVPGNVGLNLKLMSNLRKCEKSESSRREIEGVYVEREHICVGKTIRGSSNACIVDSGGPLMADEKKDDGTGRMTVFGVAYMENTCQDFPGKPENLPAIFTNVYNYVDWIVEYMNI